MPGLNVKGRPMEAIVFRFDKFLATNLTLRGLIRAAYDVQSSQIAGGPDWLDSEKFDVNATISSSLMDKLSKLSLEEASRERLSMLQNLLADRFKLALHRETRDLPGYALVVAPGGPELQVSKPGDTYPNGMKDGNGRPFGAGMVVAPEPGKLIGQEVPVGVLVHEPSQQYLGRPVVDKTGLTAKYDFTLQWSPHTSPGADPPILASIHDQLGLTLQLQSNPVEVLVIDHAEQLASDESSQAQPQAQNFEQLPTASVPAVSGSSLFCLFAGVKYPEGAIIQEGDGPEQLCARVMDRGKVNKDGQPLYTVEWIHSNSAVRERGKDIIHLTPVTGRQN